MNNSGRISSGSGLSPFASNVTEAPIKRGITPSIAILLIGLAVVVLMASFGFFYLQSINRSSNTNNDAVATTQAQDATSFAITATAHATITTATVQSTNPTATISSTNPYPPPGATLALYDTLSNNNNGYIWETHPDPGGTCQFTGRSFQIDESSLNSTAYCPAYNTSFGGNFIYEVQMTIVQGELGGLIFRDDTHNKSYYFRWGQDGSYNLVYYGTSNHPQGPLASGHSPAFYTGYNQTNVIAVEVQGGNFKLYANNQFVNSVNVDTYGHGYIGLFASDYGNPTEVVYSNAKVWTF